MAGGSAATVSSTRPPEATSRGFSTAWSTLAAVADLEVHASTCLKWASLRPICDGRGQGGA